MNNSIKQLHKKWRKDFRNAVFARDGYKCKFCNIIENLDAHHITDRHLIINGGYVVENGITLCPKHHMDAEQYHISKHIAGIKGMMPDDLYKCINSSLEIAIKKSKLLK